MSKVLKPSQAVLDLSRLEFTYNRATSEPLDKKAIEFWAAYYQRRLIEIAAIYKMDPDDLITDWLKWRAEVREQLQD